MPQKEKVGRLAMRVEGDLWVAYYALPNTMKDAIFLGSIQMPYVEVWVDPVCEGECHYRESLGKLKRRRDFGLSLLFEGKVDEAIDALTRGKIPEDFQTDDELREKFADWKRNRSPSAQVTSQEQGAVQ